jgi:LacI family transcriptional regulator
MCRLIDYVARLEHRRIGNIGGHPGFETTLERIIGYRHSLQWLGLNFDERYLVTDNASTASGAEATHALLFLLDPTTAIVAGNHMAAIGAMQDLTARGLTVPDDTAVAGFDCEDIGGRTAFLLTSGSPRPKTRGAQYNSTPRSNCATLA